MKNILLLIEAITYLSWSLYDKLSSSENMVISPSSIYIALAMTAIGSKEDTLEEFKKLLQFSDIEELVKNLEELQKYMLQKGEDLEI